MHSNLEWQKVDQWLPGHAGGAYPRVKAMLTMNTLIVAVMSRAYTCQNLSNYTL